MAEVISTHPHGVGCRALSEKAQPSVPGTCSSSRERGPQPRSVRAPRQEAARSAASGKTTTTQPTRQAKTALGESSIPNRKRQKASFSIWHRPHPHTRAEGDCKRIPENAATPRNKVITETRSVRGDWLMSGSSPLCPSRRQGKVMGKGLRTTECKR